MSSNHANPSRPARIHLAIGIALAIIFVITLRWLATSSEPDAGANEPRHGSPALDENAADSIAPQPAADSKVDAAESRRDEIAAESPRGPIAASKRAPREIRKQFVVRVLDANGDPAEGIMTRVFAVGDSDTHCARMLTDDSGNARYDAEATRIFFSALPDDQRYAVVADIEFSRLAKTERTFAELLAEPTVLELPPVGTVSVTLLRGATPFAERAKVKLLRFDEVVDDSVVAKPGAAPTPRTTLLRDLVTQNGIARFERVEAGVKIGVEVDYEAGVFETPTADFVLCLPSSTREIAVDLTAVPCFLLRAISPVKGEPLVVGSLEIEWIVADKATYTYIELVRRVDVAGRVRFSWPAAIPQGRPARLRLRAYDREEVGSADVDISRFVAPGEHDLSDIRLQGVRRLVSGIVLDVRGAGVKNAILSLAGSAPHPDSATGGPPTNGGIDQIFAFTDAAGRFAVDSSMVASRGRIVAYSFGLGYARPTEFACGESVTLRLGGIGSCSGAVRGASKGASVEIESIEIDENEFGGFLGASTAPIGFDGRFEFPQVDSGTARIRIVRDGIVLATIPDVVIPNGEAAKDSRLSEIEIR